MPLLKSTRQNSPAFNGALIFFTLFWNGIFIFMGIAMWRQGGFGPFFVGIVPLLPFIVIGLLLIAICVWAAFASLVKRMNLAQPEVALSKDMLRIGEEFSFSYLQVFKRAVSINSIVVEFILRETAVYLRATDTRTDTHDKIVQEFHHLGQHYQAGQAFHENWTVRVPADGMHTFIAKHNKVQWILKFHLRIARWPDITEEYELKVVPERVW
jgi:hypothetical protein